MLNPVLDRRTPSRLAVLASTSLVIAAVIVAAALRLAAQGGALSVEGTVFDPSGGVLPGVEVTLEDANRIKWPTTTGPDGKFKFDPVGAGTVLEASLPASSFATSWCCRGTARCGTSRCKSGRSRRRSR
jgi:hypothetical protein